MKTHLLALLLSHFFIQAPYAELLKSDDNLVVTRFAFGSCANQELPQPIWKVVTDSQPQFFVHLGDNIYADSPDSKVIEAKYKKQSKIPEYAEFRKKILFTATWDDHDFTDDDADGSYSRKDDSQQKLLNFMDEPKDSPIRTQKGVYRSLYFGPSDKRVQILILDLRYFRSDFKVQQSSGKYALYEPDPTPTKTMMGETQWKWFLDELKKPANIRIIASSVQVISNEHTQESWGLLPLERQKLLDAIDTVSKNESVIVLSGDRHFAEISKIKLKSGRILYDLTASGLAHAYRAKGDEKNKHRVKAVTGFDHYGELAIEWKRKPRFVYTVKTLDKKNDSPFRF